MKPGLSSSFARLGIHSFRSGAYTLIEILAVVVILGLVASLSFPHLVRLASDAQLTEPERRLVACDRRLRDHADIGPLRVTLSGSGLVATTVGQSQPFEVWQVQDQSHLEWADSAGKPLTTYLIDGRGRSRDLVVTFRSGSRIRKLSLYGLIGEWGPVSENEPGNNNAVAEKK